MLTKIQIIEETISYYKINPRSLSEGSSQCLYNGPNGEKCAFSRCCTEDSSFNEQQSSNAQDKAKLLPQYSHIPYDDQFWMDLQEFHDMEANWDINVLTSTGLNRVNKLKEMYK
jgi:hypothetical protein